MTNIIEFVPLHEKSTQKNLEEFIRMCREDLTVFGKDLDWNLNYWKKPGVTFGNVDQKTSKLSEENVLCEPFLQFAKAYFRYIQGRNPSQHYVQLRALKCLERALVNSGRTTAIDNVDIGVFDAAADIARASYSAGTGYHSGRELEAIAKFITEKNLVSTRMDWKNPIGRPTDTIRTGRKAKELREKKLPETDALYALADIFAKNSNVSRDVFTTSVAAMLLCAPSRISEVLSLPLDCEVQDKKEDGVSVSGWRFQPGKGGTPLIKWIPEAMETLAKEAILRIKELTTEARAVALWYEKESNGFYRHKGCPDVPENEPLTIVQAAAALGIDREHPSSCADALGKYGLSAINGGNTLADLNQWLRARLPDGFPWFDRARGIRFSQALFCMLRHQLRDDFSTSPVLLWKPTANTFNEDLCGKEKVPGKLTLSIFDRHGFNDGRENALKVTSHAFRHLINTMSQRGGMSQSEIARWSGRIDVKQNRVYDHMSEFELVEMLRKHDTSLVMPSHLTEMAEQVTKRLPMTTQEFNSLVIPTAHITEYGFCIHDYVMSPCQRFRDCLNCSEQVCIKGDRRIERIKERRLQVKSLREDAESEIADGTAGADRWYEIQVLTEKRLNSLVEIFDDPTVENGTIIQLNNDNEFSPLLRVLESKMRPKALKLTSSHSKPELNNEQGVGNGKASKRS